MKNVSLHFAAKSLHRIPQYLLFPFFDLAGGRALTLGGFTP
mgnify:CR=1 FL=1